MNLYGGGPWGTGGQCAIPQAGKGNLLLEHSPMLTVVNSPLVQVRLIP